MRVLLAEDEDAYGALTEAVLAGVPGLELAGRARNGLEAVSLTGELSPDLVLMDIVMPELDGLAATERIRDLYPHVRVIVLSSLQARDAPERAAAAGAAAFVGKERMAQELVEAIRAAVAR